MAQINGTPDNDTLAGTAEQDVMRGRAGDDTLRGLDGNDTITGGKGLDLLEGGVGDDQLSGGKDNDELRGEEGVDALHGAAGDDDLDGGPGNDALRGSGGNDSLDGRTGNDLLEGGNGSDVLRGGNDNDVLRGGPGDDDLQAGSGDDTLYGAAGNDALAGAAGNDILEGDNGNDDLDGSLGTDTLLGGDGDDRISGGDGTDTAIFTGNLADYSIDEGDDDQVLVTDDEPDLPEDNDDEGTDTLVGVEILRFADRTTNRDGSNSFPDVDPDKTLSVVQDSTPVVIGIGEPGDPDGDDLSIRVLELPAAALGTVRNSEGEPVQVGDEPIVFELVRFTFTPADGVSGAAGRFVYSVDDSNQGIVTQTITIVITEPDPGVIALDMLNGKTGFTIEGTLEDDQLGSCVGGGRDIDGDGFSDLVVGARTASGIAQTGKSYVIFGDDTHPARRPVGTAGDATLFGRGPKDRLGVACALTTDADGDETPDVLLGARGLGEAPNLPPGEAFFVRGVIGRSGFLDLKTLDGDDGFRVQGHTAEDLAGSVVADAGDFNDDGLSDLLIGASGVDAASAEERGEIYLLFGKDDLSAHNLDLSTIDENDGLRLLGAARRDAAGGSVAGAGDVNGDGIDDIIVGTSYADPNGTRSGRSYVLFGTSTPSDNGVLSLTEIDGENGFTIDGSEEELRSGFDVAGAGDVNGDGFDDLLIGAPGLSDFGDSMGGAFVVYGGEDVGAGGSVQLGGLSPQQGFLMRGASALDLAGTSVAGIGDFNDDGFDDVLVGTPEAEPNGPGSGAVYVVFGSAEGPEEGVLELFTLDGSNGLVLQGPEKSRAGSQVAAAGDVNNDGFADVVIGAALATPKGKPLAGEVYVVFGRASQAPASAAVAQPSQASIAAAVPMLGTALPGLIIAATTVARIALYARRLRRRQK